MFSVLQLSRRRRRVLDRAFSEVTAISDRCHYVARIQRPLSPIHPQKRPFRFLLNMTTQPPA